LNKVIIYLFFYFFCAQKVFSLLDNPMVEPL